MGTLQGRAREMLETHPIFRNGERDEVAALGHAMHVGTLSLVKRMGLKNYQLGVNVTVPVGSVATVVVPLQAGFYATTEGQFDCLSISEYGTGHVFSVVDSGRVVLTAPGVVSVSLVDETAMNGEPVQAVKVEVGSGSYAFVSALTEC